MGGLQIPRWLGSDPLSAWWLGLAPATLEFWGRFPNERNQGKQAHPVLKYRVPQGSQCVMSRLIHTGLGSSSLIAHVLYSPPPPREQLCNRSCSNKTHTFSLRSPSRIPYRTVTAKVRVGVVAPNCCSASGVCMRRLTLCVLTRYLQPCARPNIFLRQYRHILLVHQIRKNQTAYWRE
jgi:hypothetical protein